MDAGRCVEHVSGSHLLVVDDDRGTREFLSLCLGQQGFDVAVVEDGKAMDAWLTDNTTDFVVLDLMLPGEVGLSIARRRCGLPQILDERYGGDAGGRAGRALRQL